MSTTRSTTSSRALAWLAALGATCAALAAPEDKFYATRPDGPRAVLMRDGEEMPRVALYRDGRAIFRAADPSLAPSGYLLAHAAAPAASLAPESLMQLGDAYVALAEVNPPGYVLYLWGDGRRKAISVFGDLKSAKARARVPPALLRSLESLENFSAAGSPWPPTMIEVYLLPLRHSRGEPLPWPQGIPPYGYSGMDMKDGLNAMGMASSHFAILYKLLARLQPGQAVRLQERNWTVSTSFALPFEEAWAGRSRDRLVRPSPVVSRPAPAAEPSVVFEVRGGMGRGGPGSALFALYADGLAIAAARDGSGYRSTRLTDSQYKTLIAAIAPEGLLTLADEYDAITATDPVENVIHVWIDGRRKTVSVAGHLDSGLPFGGRSKTPPAFLRAYDAISRFPAPAAPWLPPQIEVTLWPIENFNGPVVYWPQGWPALESARLSRSGAHRFLLAASEYARLRNLASGDTFRAVRAENRLWRIEYRLPFPNEATWAQR